MVIGIPKETAAGENRVAVTPDTAAKLIKMGFEVRVEKGAGQNAHYTDEQYTKHGAAIAATATDLLGQSDIILKVQKPSDAEIKQIKKGALLISFVYGLNYPQVPKACAEAGVNLMSMDFIPRTTLAQKMDALSSQYNIAGYKAVLMCAAAFGKMFPLMMTAAGTISPAKVVIMGAGVAGLQAIGTARRLGAVVEVSDVRAAVKEEVQSLGGKFIEVPGAENMQDAGGYAKEASAEFLQKQKELLFKHITEADIVITTALVPGKKAPVLVTEEMIKHMRHGSIVLDMAVEFGGNCEVSEAGKTVTKHGVTIIGESNIPATVPTHASELYSKNLLALLQYIAKDGNLQLKLEDEIVKSALLVHNGVVVNERIKQVL
ncbi:MAG TPA: Re/Si-specific NAD(P)(+) transhydrogenase subunit alpha [bacterium]|nr:Re/Si-specific NAD(P)(+) transhydrogenase subunit alpha [bacterium]HMZ05864.1 Re/Si-specific NAD(P)(+) transhydrogenase subunit alpha [bacterium]HND77860.1 Re/Si-specific NAD(P)(+) transhydrogenase subunit alpha [bacterium]HNH29835.1 Re/Si-specific NAD(P)(+) transhydrogenase subunit alpha [bacterium]HNO11109.1 Re/Si-specific NAD(P)(+) transhydrogenase subunit alpha [bacterium]